MFLDVSHLQVRYDRRPEPAVDDVSFGLRAGEIGVLIGPSGCGKTTLLRTVAGLEPARAGEIRLAGRVVSSATLQLPAEQRRIGMVFQDYALFPHLDVARNVAFGLAHLPRGARAERAAQVLELVGLAGFGPRFAHELSGGQQQRVALARALAPQPQLLLLDEPFSNLDVELRERLAQEVRAILKAAQATALFVTHDQLEAFAIGDAIGVMHAGRLHQWADASTLYHRPATRFVADFIGHGVLLPASTGPDGALHTPLGALGSRRAERVPPGSAGAPRDLLLRAEDVVYDDAAAVQGQLVAKAFGGAAFLYTLRLASGETVLAQVPSHHDHAIGEWIGLRAEVDRLVTFPREPLVG